MDAILIPGFWLDASSWDDIAPVLREAGHTVHAVTLPGLESKQADRGGITLRDHVDAVTDLVDSIDGPVVLVGHSGGGAVAHAVADARPERIARIVYVDSGPMGDGQSINDAFTVVGDEVPLPDWDEFEDEELVDLDDAAREAFRERAIPIPARVASDPQRLSGDGRVYDVPVTIITSTFPSEQMRELLDRGSPWVAELGKVKDFELIDLPTGHWPQLTRPDDHARAIAAAIDRG
jgi:pimeloyl-ACP methyl ester carboxylesterase